jgi:hypothetical protein
MNIAQSGHRKRGVNEPSGSRLAASLLGRRDETFTRLSAMDMVEAAGCEAFGALSADEAVRLLEIRTDIRVVFNDVQASHSEADVSVRLGFIPRGTARLSGRALPKLGIAIYYLNSGRKETRPPTEAVLLLRLRTSDGLCNSCKRPTGGTLKI